MPKLFLVGRCSATAGYHIDVKGGRITFEVQVSYVMFSHIEEKVVSPSSSLLDAFPLSPEIDLRMF